MEKRKEKSAGWIPKILKKEDEYDEYDDYDEEYDDEYEDDYEELEEKIELLTKEKDAKWPSLKELKETDLFQNLK